MRLVKVQRLVLGPGRQTNGIGIDASHIDSLTANLSDHYARLLVVTLKSHGADRDRVVWRKVIVLLCALHQQ